MIKTLSAAAAALSVTACAHFSNAGAPTFSHKIDKDVVTLSSSDPRLGQHVTTCKEVTELASLFNIHPTVNDNLAEYIANNPNNGGLTKEQAKEAAHGLIKAVKGAALECNR